MKTWLARREAIDIFSEYLRWSMPGYDAETDPLDGGLTPDNNDSPGDDEPPEPSITGRSDEVSFSVAVRPPFPKTSIDTITTKFHAPDFLHCLYTFLRRQDILPKNFNSIDPAVVNFPVFKRLNLLIPNLPEVSTEGCQTWDVVHACITAPEKGLKKGAPETFDTVFAQKDPLMGDRLKWWSSKGMKVSLFGWHAVTEPLSRPLCCTGPGNFQPPISVWNIRRTTRLCRVVQAAANPRSRTRDVQDITLKPAASLQCINNPCQPDCS